MGNQKIPTRNSTVIQRKEHRNICTAKDRATSSYWTFFHTRGIGQINGYWWLSFFSRYKNQEVATYTKTTYCRLRNTQVGKAGGQENMHAIPLKEGQMLKQEMPLQVQRSPKRTEHSPHLSGLTLAQAAQRSCGCPLPGSVQGQVGWSSEQPGLVEDVPAHGGGVGTRWSLRSLPTLTILLFYDSMKEDRWASYQCLDTEFQCSFFSQPKRGLWISSAVSHSRAGLVAYSNSPSLPDLVLQLMLLMSAWVR